MYHKGELMKAIGKLVSGLLLIGALGLSGCSSKKFEVSDDSVSVLDKYEKKQLPEFYFWNFGIGSSYSEALKDAQKSMLVKDYHKLDYSVYKTTGSTNVTAENHKVFTGTKMCEVHKNMKVPEGYLLIRICKDTSAMINDSRNEKPFIVDYAWAYKLETYLKREMQKEENRKDKAYYNEFLTNCMYRIDIGEQFFYNFQYKDFEAIQLFITTDFKKWVDNRKEFLPKRYREEAYYPFDLRYNSYTRKSDWSQLWKTTEGNFVFCTKDQLSDPIMLGLVDVPERTGIVYIGLKKPKKDDF